MIRQDIYFETLTYAAKVFFSLTICETQTFCDFPLVMKLIFPSIILSGSLSLGIDVLHKLFYNIGHRKRFLTRILCLLTHTLE